MSAHSLIVPLRISPSVTVPTTFLFLVIIKNLSEHSSSCLIASKTACYAQLFVFIFINFDTPNHLSKSFIEFFI